MTQRKNSKDQIPRGIDLGPSGFDPNSDYQSVHGSPPASAQTRPAQQGYGFGSFTSSSGGGGGGDDWQDDSSGGVPSSWEIKLSMLAHVLGAIGVLGAVVGGILGPVIVWWLYRNESRFVEHHAREAINFQITVWVVSVVSFMLAIFTCGLFALPSIIVPIAFQLVFGILATVAAQQGQWYRYPLCIRLLKSNTFD